MLCKGSTLAALVIQERKVFDGEFGAVLAEDVQRDCLGLEEELVDGVRPADHEQMVPPLIPLEVRRGLQELGHLGGEVRGPIKETSLLLTIGLGVRHGVHMCVVGDDKCGGFLWIESTPRILKETLVEKAEQIVLICIIDAVRRVN